VNTRESVRITRADRTPASLAIYPGESKARAEYLIETLEPAHYGLFAQYRAAAAAGQFKPGKPLWSREQLLKLREEEIAKKAAAAK
jgi:hypothetical protein